jgi:hypothetical protein
MSSLSKKIKTRREYYFLLFLISIDLALIGGNLLQLFTSYSTHEKLTSLSQDNSYGERFQYLKFGAIALLLYLSSKVKKSILLGGWALIFLMLLVDDAISVHERLGARLAQWFSISDMYNLRSVDYGEIIVFLMLGAIAAGILTITSRIDRTPLSLQISKALLLFLVGLAFFGGIMDMLHSVAQETSELSQRENIIFGIVEDGGEMIIVSLTLWFVYCFYLSLRPQSS